MVVVILKKQATILKISHVNNLEKMCQVAILEKKKKKKKGLLLPFFQKVGTLNMVFFA